jgi:hypothetical protein
VVPAISSINAIANMAQVPKLRARIFVLLHCSRRWSSLRDDPPSALKRWKSVATAQ